ncbi:MAG TPA: response regulator [Spirochaetota bacterium]|nr:response regulator [Spirochaetota bacterium]
MPEYRIIIVDDDPNLISGLRRSLFEKSSDWDIYYTETAQDAIKQLSAGTYDLIITDYKMPGMNGLELLSHVKEKFPAVKRILLTGQSESEVFETSQDIVHVYLSKPLPTAELINAIETLIDSPK